MPAFAHAQHSKLSLESIGPAGGNGAFPADLVGPLDANKRVLMTTSEHLTSSDTDSADDVYSRTGGTTTLLSTGSTGGNGPYPANFGRAVQAGSRLIFQTDERLVGGDTDDSLDVYERSSGTTTLVSTGPASGANGAYDSFFAGASSDGSRIFFTTRGALVGTDTDTSLDVYERSSGSTSLVSIGPAGGNGTPGSDFAGISDDGTKVFFETRDSLVASDTDSAQDVYQRSGGTTTLLSTGAAGGNGTPNAFFDHSSLDGSRVFFHTEESLVAADTDVGADVYERSSGSTTLISVSLGSSAVRSAYAGSSEDGTKVYIETLEKLLTTDKDSFNDVYVSSGGTLTLPAPGGNDNQGSSNAYWAGNSADGSKLFIRSEEPLVAGDTDQYQDIFEYSGGALTRLSLGPSGGNGPAHAWFAGASTDGAHVYFQTYEALAATDTDTNLDIYERYGGTTYHISTGSSGGNGAYDATFRATSTDGQRVFFRTDESLLAADTDGSADLYSANVPGTVTVALDSLPNDPQDFDFQAYGLDDGFAFGPPTFGPTLFQLDDDSNPTLSNQRVFTGVTPGLGYSVTQDAVPGWDPTGATCDNGSPVTAIDVSAGQSVTCTFTNQKRGQIVVVLDTQPNDPQDFDFTAGGGLAPASFQLDDDSDGTLSNTLSFTDVAIGTGYSVSQTLPPGWTQESATCDDGSTISNIGVSAGETVTCTFTNDKRGRIIVVKDAQPNDPQDFSFTAGGGLSPTSFQLDDDADPTLDRQLTFEGVPVGSGYSIAETVPSGWIQGSVSCDDGSPVTNIGVSPAETVTCTFVNLKRGQIVVVKDAQPDDAQDFSFTAGGGLSPTSFQLDDDANATLSNTRTFTNVAPGTGYSVAESSVPSGWDLSTSSCSDGSSLSNIGISPGEVVTCTFTNKKRGQIVIVEDSVPNDSQDFSFTAAGGLSPTSFVLDDDSQPTNSNTRTFANLQARNGYSVSESAPPSGWGLASATCSDGSPVSNIDVGPNETVTCTFRNEKHGSLTIVKDAQNNNAQDFSFSVSPGLSPATFLLDDDNDGTLSNTRTYSDVAPGTYAASETSVPSGWDLSSATCSDGSAVSAINLAIGENVTCTFTNRKRGNLLIVLDSQPNDPQDITFTAGGGLAPSSFQLDDDTDPGLTNQMSFNNIPAVSGYSVSQAVPSGWVQASATCSDGSPVSNIDIGPNETVSCTFTTQKRGQIVVVKDATPDDPQDFSFSAGGGLSPSSFQLDDDANATLSNTRTYTDVAPGSGYSLSETVPSGWDQASATCDDGSPVSNINLAPAEIVTCTFSNRKRGQIIVVKDATPDDPQDFSFTAGGGLSPTSFQLDDDANPTLSNTRTFANVAAGTGYSVAETVPSGWDQTSATCSDGSPVSNIDLAPAETVTCTFANRKRGQIIVVEDSLPDDPQDFSFTAGGGLSPTSFQLDDDANATLSNTRTYSDVVPGSGYSLSETVPSGWDQTSASCSDGSPVSNIDVSTAEIVTCTFTNRKRGQIVAVKDARPNDAQDFSFTAGGGLSPSSFQLDDDADGTLSNTRTFTDIVPGSGFSLAETVPSGWDQASATCNDGSPVSNINVSAGEVVTCTFTNDKRGQIVVVHDAVPDDAQDFSFTAGGGLSPSSFQLDDDLDPGLSNTRTFTDLPAGSGYSVAETVPAGWSLAGATCNDGSPVSNISVSADETVTCTFTNQKQGQIVVHENSTPNDPQDFSFTAGGGLSPSSFQLDDDSDGTLPSTQTFTGVTPGGGYSFSETVPAGWDQISATCDDGSPVSNVNVSPGEIVNCTFLNRKRGQIVVVKDATPDDPQDFDFTAGGGLSPSSFQLDDDANATLSNTRTFANLVVGSYSLAETVPSGWDQTSATCSDGSPVSAIVVNAGETVTCTFSNQKRGQIVVVKDATPNDAQDFDFTAGGGLSPSSFQLDDDADGTLSNTRTFTTVPPGSGYSIAETVPTGWDQTGATCSDGSAVSNIDVAPGETVTCTFANRKRGQIIAVKDARPNDAQDFSFTAGGGLSPSSFQLDDDADGTLSNAQTFTNVVPGSGFSLAETVPAGWDQASATCDDGSPVSNISVSAGETVTCTFTNDRRGQVVIVHNAVPDDPQDFSFTAGGGLSPPSFQLDDDLDPGLSNTRTFTDVPAGSGYSVAESVPANWDLSSATCDDGSPVSNISVSAAEVVTCTFTNQKRGQIVVVKDATPDDPQDFSFTAGGGLSPSSFQLDDDANPTLSNTRTFTGVTPGGGYSLSETVPGGWDQTSATCDDGSAVSNVNVSPGEIVTCTFSNRKRGQIVVVKDATPDDPQDFSFTAGGGLSPSSFQLDDDANPTLSNTRTFANVTPGTGYSVAETVPSGWDQTGVTCSDGSPVSNIDVSAGETVTCTFSNRKKARLIVAKDAVPDDSQDFSFTAGGGLSPTSFDLDDDSDGTLPSSQTFSDLTPGSGYSVSESVPSGWDQASAGCDDGSPVSNIALSAGEVVTCTFSNERRGSIVIVENSTPNDPQDFDFTATGGLSPSSFQLDDDSNPTLPGSQTFTDVLPGGYSVSESVPTGWDQISATCDDGSSVSNIQVAPGETVTCTFLNRKRGRLIVTKEATPQDPQDFSFTAGGGLSPSSFQLDDDADGTLPNSRTFDNVPVGSYSIAETVPGGWDQTGATCDDGSPVSAIVVNAGETVTCTFANRKRGQIVVVKDATPNDPQDFSFTAGGGLSPSSFQLDDDANATLSNTRTFANVTPGTGYSVAETVPSGWDQTGAACSDGSPVSDIGVSAGEIVTCTFDNAKRASLVVVKDATPNDPQDFDFTAGGGLSPTGFQLDDDSNGTLPSSQTFNDIAPGSGYSVSESVPSGWDQTGATCSDGSPVANIALSAGESVTCTFANRKRGKIVLLEDAVPNAAQDFDFTTAGGLSPGSFQLDDDFDGTLSNTRTFADVVPGNGYGISQSAPSGWDLASATCDDGSPASNIDVAPGETVTCTFTHEQHGSVTVAKQAQPNDAQDFSFTAGGGLSPSSFQLDDDSDGTLSNTRTFSDLSAQAGYSVSENATPGWDLGSATCDDGSAVSNISVQPGEDVTCTFTNRKRGQIVIVQDSQPDDPQDFSFTAGGGLSPSSFQLDDDANATLSNMRTFTNLAAHNGYSVSQTLPSGWQLAGATCDDGSPISNIDVGPAETVTCTFTNDKRGRIIVNKDATPNDPQDFDFTAGGGLSPASFQLDDDADGTLSNTRTFNDIPPGSGYSVSESVPSGWDQTGATCDDGSSPSNIGVSAGETVTCTFANRKRGKIVVVKDAVPDDAQDFNFTAGGGLSPASFQLDDDADGTLSNTRTFNNVAPGSGYSVSETLPTGWTQVSAVCDDASPVTNVSVAAGETVTCTFVNQRGYPRPKGATPIRASLVPAYTQCTSPNRTHGPGLVFPSCNPPVERSSPLTTGSPDVAGNGKQAQMVGSVEYNAIPGNAGTPADEADVRIEVSVTDVRVRNASLDDYTGELQVVSALRITDRMNGPAENEVGTVADTPLAFTVPCSATSGGGNLGATCSLNTTADAVLPGTVSEIKRTIWGMGEVQVFDGGADGLVGTSPNTMFLRQGVFVP